MRQKKKTHNRKSWNKEGGGYLREERKKKERIMIARYKCNNEWRGDQFWREEEERICRICGEEKKSIIHILEKYKKTKKEVIIKELLSEDGKGCKVMKRIRKARQERERKRRIEEKRNCKKEIQEDGKRDKTGRSKWKLIVC